MKNHQLPRHIRVSGYRGGHVQGIAVDRAREFMYFSFTTTLVKTDMSGRVIGSVGGLAGHLGCIAYREEDGRVWGSLEYKHDSIGKEILNRIEREEDVRDGFYIVMFDVDKIDRIDMDAESDGIMRAVYLREVCEDYAAEGHRYGCSGIDGVTFAPAPGVTNGAQDLYVAYGIYGDTSRRDNDHQVLLRYHADALLRYAAPLDQNNMHNEGPTHPDGKYFVYTGNTCYGIQNLEYDAARGHMMAAVYRGEKPQFPNYAMYFIDCTRPPVRVPLAGLDEEGDTLCLADFGERDESSGIRGSNFPLGATGMIALGDGLYYFSKKFRDDDGHGSDVYLYEENEGAVGGLTPI
ncbi:MAG: hypothetical protein IJW40_08525 [Clostridia bacterium]|nr:hypothetical protein [Clostridia bacterium]